MKIMLLGYGKMGKAIEEIAKKRNHTIPFIIDHNNYEDLKKVTPGSVDVAIEFTQPDSAYNNLMFCIDNNIPVVSGTTGWLEKKKDLDEYCIQKGGAVFTSSNFSVGVNLFFHINQLVAKVMSEYPEYELALEEIHHTEKKDAPSGTAITLAERIMEEYPRKRSYVNHETQKEHELSIISKRIEKVPGTHTTVYKSPIDSIEITHTAFSREGFASGAVYAAEWLVGKKGVFGMKDMLKF